MNQFKMALPGVASAGHAVAPVGAGAIDGGYWVSVMTCGGEHRSSGERAVDVCQVRSADGPGGLHVVAEVDDAVLDT